MVIRALPLLLPTLLLLIFAFQLRPSSSFLPVVNAAAVISPPKITWFAKTAIEDDEYVGNGGNTYGWQITMKSSTKGGRSRTCSNDRVCGSDAASKCCGGRCVDTRSDTENCGGCGNRCPLSELCCGGRCVDVSVDNNNCGRCSNQCSMSEPCQFGLCGYY